MEAADTVGLVMAQMIVLILQMIESMNCAKNGLATIGIKIDNNKTKIMIAGEDNCVMQTGRT